MDGGRCSPGPQASSAGGVVDTKGQLYLTLRGNSGRLGTVSMGEFFEGSYRQGGCRGVSNVDGGVFPRQKILAECPQVNITYIAPCKHLLSNPTIFFTYLYLGSGEEAQRPRALSTLTGGLGLLPRAHTWLLTTACNFSSRESDTCSFGLRHLHACGAQM